MSKLNLPLKYVFVLLLIKSSLLLSAQPNVIFIMTDQHSANALSCRMGDKYLKTPALDSLAARGTMFTRAYTPNPLCMPARNSIFTGRHPHETKVTDNTQMTIDPAEFISMGTYFQNAGYQTAYYGKWHLCYPVAKEETHGFAETQIGGIDKTTAEYGLEFLSKKHDRPFLLVLSFLNPHNICEVARGQKLNNGPIGTPPPAPNLPPIPENLAPPRNEPDSMTLMRLGYHANPTFPVGNFNPKMWQGLRWSYYRLIEKVDTQVGRVLQSVHDLGLEENTLIIFTADHGECAGAHGFNQKTVFYEESANVPLIVSLPGQKTARRSELFASTGLDILPTMFEVAGIKGNEKLTGKSLRAAANGEEVKSWRDSIVVENNMTQTWKTGNTVPMTEGRMIRTDQYKYCVYAYGNNRESLVDIQKDPGEMNDLARDPAYNSVLLEYRTKLSLYGEAVHDPLISVILADNVKPRAFPIVNKPKSSIER